MSSAKVVLSPADFSSWADARAALIMEAKKPLKAQLDAELATAASDNDIKEIKDAFVAREKALEHELDHKQMDFGCELNYSFNFLSN